MNAKPEPWFSTNAIRIEQPLGIFYAVAIPARMLLDITYTDRLTAVQEGDTYKLRGSQRELRESRLKEIGRYIGTTEAAFPNSIILAANYSLEDGLIVEDESRRWHIEEKDDDDCLRLVIPTRDRLAPVIDGQHRLFGFTEAPSDRLDTPVLCSVFIDLPKPYQAYLFATINSTQKPVDRSQTYELFGYNIDDEPAEEWSPEKLAVFLARKLNTDPGSPFEGRIRVAAENDFSLSRAQARREGRWMVSTATIVDGITRLLTTSPKRDADALRTGKQRARDHLKSEGRKDKAPLRQLYLDVNDKVVLSAVRNFFNAVFRICGSDQDPESYLTKTVGIHALFDTLRVLAASALEEKNFSEEWFTRRVESLGGMNFSIPEFQEASGQGRTLMKNVLFTVIGLETNMNEEKVEEINALIAKARE